MCRLWQYSCGHQHATRCLKYKNRVTVYQACIDLAVAQSSKESSELKRQSDPASQQSGASPSTSNLTPSDYLVKALADVPKDVMSDIKRCRGPTFNKLLVDDRCYPCILADAKKDPSTQKSEAAAHIKVQNEDKKIQAKKESKNTRMGKSQTRQDRMAPKATPPAGQPQDDMSCGTQQYATALPLRHPQIPAPAEHAPAPQNGALAFQPEYSHWVNPPAIQLPSAHNFHPSYGYGAEVNVGNSIYGGRGVGAPPYGIQGYFAPGYGNQGLAGPYHHLTGTPYGIAHPGGVPGQYGYPAPINPYYPTAQGFMARAPMLPRPPPATSATFAPAFGPSFAFAPNTQVAATLQHQHQHQLQPPSRCIITEDRQRRGSESPHNNQGDAGT